MAKHPTYQQRLEKIANDLERTRNQLWDAHIMMGRKAKKAITPQGEQNAELEAERLRAKYYQACVVLTLVFDLQDRVSIE